MSYKMLIADDESFVINGLKNSIPWEQYGIEIIGEASDGLEALEIINNQHVDILFTDIIMPELDGIQLIEEIRKQKKKIKIVVLSGFNDFDYARSAIHYRVTEYLLKPATLEKIQQVVQRIVIQCDEERDHKKHDMELESKLCKALPRIEERFYLSLLFGLYEKDLHEYLGLDLKNYKFKVITAHIDNLFSGRMDHLTQKEKQLKIIHVNELLKTELREPFNIIILPYAQAETVLLFKLDNEDEMALLISKLGKVQQRVREYVSTTISFGYGNSYTDIRKIQDSFKESKEALKHKLYYGNESIIAYGDIVNNQGSYIDTISDLKQSFIDSIKLQDAEKSDQLLQRMHDILQNDKRYKIYYVRKLCMEIILILSMTLYDKNEELELIYNKKVKLLDYIQQLETLDIIFDTLIDISKTVINYLNEKSKNRNKNTLNKIINYIHENIDKEITLEKIASEVYLTPNYTGHIFKENMSMSFNEYVTQVRMEYAKKFLMQPENKIYDVSFMVGYKNPHYFSKLFKKHTGVSPSAFKDW